MPSSLLGSCWGLEDWPGTHPKLELVAAPDVPLAQVCLHLGLGGGVGGFAVPSRRARIRGTPWRCPGCVLQGHQPIQPLLGHVVLPAPREEAPVGVPAGSPGLDVPRRGECSMLGVPAWLCHCSHYHCPVLLWPHRSVSSTGSTAFIPPESPVKQMGGNATNLGRIGATALIFFKRGYFVLECLIFFLFFFPLEHFTGSPAPSPTLLLGRSCCQFESISFSDGDNSQLPQNRWCEAAWQPRGRAGFSSTRGCSDSWLAPRGAAPGGVCPLLWGQGPVPGQPARSNFHGGTGKIRCPSFSLGVNCY